MVTNMNVPTERLLAAAEARASFALPAGSRRPQEAAEHRLLVDWLNLQRDLRGWWTHPANEDSRPAARRINLSRGVSPGIPDFLIFRSVEAPAGGSLPPGVGLAVELKRPRVLGMRGRPLALKKPPTSEQVAWLRRLREAGWYAAVAYGARHASAVIAEAYGLPGRL